MHRHVPHLQSPTLGTARPAVYPSVGLNHTVRQHPDRRPATAPRLPNFLVIGAQRAGTTLLHRVLEAHPDVYVPYRRKEVHYFDWYFDRGLHWYQEFFPPPGGAETYRAIGEVTPDYLFAQEVPLRIHELLPNCRFIVSLRNPVDRAYSAYLYSVRSHNEQRGVDEFLLQNRDTLRCGCYAGQLTRYLQLFPREAFLILIYEELVADPSGQLARIAAFLGLDRGWHDPGALMQERVNTSEIPRFPAAFALARRVGALLSRSDLDGVVRWAKRHGIPRLFGHAGASRGLPEPTRRMLEDFYRDEVAALEAIVGHDLRRWWPNFGALTRAILDHGVRTEELRPVDPSS